MTEKWKYVLPHTYNSLNGRSGGTGGSLVPYEKKHVQAELFDLTVDKNELHNVISTHPEVVQYLSSKADNIRHILGDKITGVKGSEVRALGSLE